MNAKPIGAPLLKVGRLAPALRKLERIRKDKRAKLEDVRKHRIQATRIRLEVFRRDRWVCRACFRRMLWQHDDPRRVGHAHHVVYRSAGGSDQPSNLVTLCAACHEQEHQHLLTIEGRPDATLTFTLRDTHRNVLHVWESPNPSGEFCQGSGVAPDAGDDK